MELGNGACRATDVYKKTLEKNKKMKKKGREKEKENWIYESLLRC
jgi:hypothetical protein